MGLTPPRKGPLLQWRPAITSHFSRMSIHRLPQPQIQAEAETPHGWDAFQVWKERVRYPHRDKSAAPPRSWDPYLVWLSRVKKVDQ